MLCLSEFISFPTFSLFLTTPQCQAWQSLGIREPLGLLPHLPWILSQDRALPDSHQCKQGVRWGLQWGPGVSSCSSR